MNLLVRSEGRRGPLASGTVSLLAVVGLLLPLLSTTPAAVAGEPQKRDYAVLVDGKPMGEYHAVIQQADDGTVTLKVQSDVRVTVLAVPVYTYTYVAQEVWKNGRLLHFESNGKEDSKMFAVAADLNGDTLRVTANGTSSQVRPDVLLTSCWQLPVPGMRNVPVPMLSCDSGVVTTGELDFIANEKLMVAGQELVCAHYRVTKNNILHDYWFDGQERMVRDEWLPRGNHRTVLELTKIGQ